MKNRTKTSTSRIALGAILLVLAATASSCGMALPTSPALDTGVATPQRAATTHMAGPGDMQMGDFDATGGGPDITAQPPAGVACARTSKPAPCREHRE